MLVAELVTECQADGVRGFQGNFGRTGFPDRSFQAPLSCPTCPYLHESPPLGEAQLGACPCVPRIADTNVSIIAAT